jgi:hypothetical protein
MIPIEDTTYIARSLPSYADAETETEHAAAVAG